MTLFARKNFARGVLASAFDVGHVQLTMATGHNLPTGSDSFRLVVWNWARYPDPADDTNLEIVTAVYSGTTNIYDTTRAQESTAESLHIKDDRVALHYTAGMSEDDLNQNAKYFGDPNVNGSWKFEIVGTSLLAYRKEADVWVKKGGFTA